MKVRQIVQSGLFLTLLIICSHISFPIGIIPITLQTLAVRLIGHLLTPKQALLTTVTYVVLGLTGFPISADGTVGVSLFIKPSFGFMISFIVTSVFISMFIHKYGRTLKNHVLADIVGSLIIFSLGASYMWMVLTHVLQVNVSWIDVLNMGVIPFIPGDILKTIMALIITRRIEIFHYKSINS